MAPGTLDIAPPVRFAAPIVPPAPCPRCGYDLGGTVQTWTSACPIEGICNECGLSLAWGDVLVPERDAPAWFVECPPGNLAQSRVRRACNRALRWVRTLARLARPWRVWSEVTLSTRVRPVTLAVVALTALLMLHLAWSVWFARDLILAQTHAPAALVTKRLLRALAWPYPNSDAQWFWLAPLAAAIAPVALLCLATTFSRARVRRAHIARAGVYGVAGVAAILLLARVCLIGVLATQLFASPAPRPTARHGFPLPGASQSRYAMLWGHNLRPFWDSVLVIGRHSAWPMALALVWLGFFWWFITTRYLRLPHAIGIVLCAMLIGILGAAAIMQELPGSEFEWYRHSFSDVFRW